MSRHRALLKLLLTMAFLTSTTSYAVVGDHAYIGALAGANFANNGNPNSSTTGSFCFGLEGGAKVMPVFGIGFYGTYFSQNNTVSVFGLPAGTTFGTYTLTGEANFFVSWVHAGVDLGASIFNWSTGYGSLSTSTTNASFVFGPEVGIDIPLGPTPVSIGAEAHLLFNTMNSVEDNLQLLASLKIWI